MLQNIVTLEKRFRLGNCLGNLPDCPSGLSWKGLMHKALRLARRAYNKGEIPVGALIVDENGIIISEEHNRTEELHDPTAHAEILAIRKASEYFGNHRLNGCYLVVTLEPCLMCTGAIREARLSGIVFGATDSHAGAIVSCMDGFEFAGIGVPTWFYYGLESRQSVELLQNFFKTKRKI